MGTKRKAQDMSSTDQIKIEQPVGAAAEADAVVATEETPKAAIKKRDRRRSSKYRAVRAQIDKTKKYDPFAAVELVKKLSYSSFDGTITAHVVVHEVGITANVTLPHATGKSVRVAVVNDDVLKDIEAGKLDFDVLISTPQYMPKLARFAPVLGPKGLMPNPKNGTLTGNPEAQKKKLEAGSTTLKTEKKAPLMHIRVGKTSMATKELVENIEAIMKSLNTKIDRMAIAASMSPGIKVAVS